MKTISNGRALCSAVIAITCLSGIAKGETWSCEQSRGDKTVKQAWIVSGDRLTTPGDERYYRIVRNDQRTLVAFRKDWEYKIGGGTPLVSYVIIEKATGALIDLNDPRGGVQSHSNAGGRGRTLHADATVKQRPSLNQAIRHAASAATTTNGRVGKGATRRAHAVIG
jgi:hypothetical protein